MVLCFVIVVTGDNLSLLVSLSHSRGVRVSEKRSEQILHFIRIVVLKACCVRMYTVRCRVIANNKCEFQHSFFLSR